MIRRGGRLETPPETRTGVLSSVHPTSDIGEANAQLWIEAKVSSLADIAILNYIAVLNFGALQPPFDRLGYPHESTGHQLFVGMRHGGRHLIRRYGIGLRADPTPTLQSQIRLLRRGIVSNGV